MTAIKDIIARAAIDTLERVAAERDRRYAERFAAQETANKLALEAAEKAVLKAENASEKRFEGVNEFRAALSDQAGSFITRKEVEALLLGVNDKLGRLDNQASASAGRGIGMGQLWVLIVGGIELLVAVATVARSFIK